MEGQQKTIQRLLTRGLATTKPTISSKDKTEKPCRLLYGHLDKQPYSVDRIHTELDAGVNDIESVSSSF